MSSAYSKGAEVKAIVALASTSLRTLPSERRRVREKGPASTLASLLFPRAIPMQEHKFRTRFTPIIEKYELGAIYYRTPVRVLARANSSNNAVADLAARRAEPAKKAPPFDHGYNASVGAVKDDPGSRVPE